MLDAWVIAEGRSLVVADDRAGKKRWQNEAQLAQSDAAKARRDAERAKADAERAKADAERIKAEAQEQRARQEVLERELAELKAKHGGA